MTPPWRHVLSESQRFKRYIIKRLKSGWPRSASRSSQQSHSYSRYKWKSNRFPVKRGGFIRSCAGSSISGTTVILSHTDSLRRPRTLIDKEKGEQQRDIYCNRIGRVKAVFFFCFIFKSLFRVAVSASEGPGGDPGEWASRLWPTSCQTRKCRPSGSFTTFIIQSLGERRVSQLLRPQGFANTNKQYHHN